MKNIRFSSTPTSIALTVQSLPLTINSHPTSSPIHNAPLIFSSKKSKRLKSSQLLETSEKCDQINKLRQTMMTQYKYLMEFYETNQEKLRRIILKQLNQNNSYLYSKQIMSFIKFPKHQIFKSVNFQLFRHDLSKLISFLSNFNAKKRIKQVQIIKESMLSRQIMIRESSSLEEYQDIYKNMRIPLKTPGFTIYDQYKSIRADHNLPLHPDNIHEKLYNKMCDAEQCVNSVMKNEASKKERQKYRVLGLSIPKDPST